MVDPVKCTNFSRDQYHLEEFAIFSICVANKPALRIAKLLHDMLVPLDGDLPFTKLKKYDRPGITDLIMKSKMGCHTMKGRGVHQLVNKDLDLRTCTAEELEEICGIGLKTSRFFLLHSRENQRCIPLDTHILKFLKDNGVKDVPSSTPSSASKYRELENKALGFADKRKMKPAEFDLSVWREYSGNTVSAVTGESYDADLRKAL
jgi:hypothetical protein